MNITRVHFVGIKGVGMAALAVIMKEAGLVVTGSDLSEQYITDTSLLSAGIKPFAGFSHERVSRAQLVVTTGAHGGFENVEVVSAKENGVRVVTFAEAVGMVMDGTLLKRNLKGISIAGTHGKTTTTAMIATILSANDLDPSYLVGTSHIPTLSNSGHYGKGDYFVVEADEYATEPTYDKRAKFLWHTPKIVVITNIEHDHPDIYPTLEDFTQAFYLLLQSLTKDSIVVANGDDPQIQKLIKNYQGRIITFGFQPRNDYVINDVRVGLDKTYFNAASSGKDLGEFELQVPGEHNCLNALASVIVSLEAGLDLAAIKNALSTFRGSKRRLELIGTMPAGAILYDDYAHHPTEIQKTLKALRKMYPAKKLISIFQPHTYTRTKALFSEFGRSFEDSDTVILLKIFSSAREKSDPSISSEMVVAEVKKYKDEVYFLPEVDDVVKYLSNNPPGPDSVVVMLGAGDVYKIGEKLQVIGYKL